MAQEQLKNENNTPWPSHPKSYQWKGTLSFHSATWNVLAHCKLRKADVFIKIKQTHDDDSDIDEFTETIKNLINIQHTNLLTPVHAFVYKSEIWVIYPRHSGGPLIEVLTSHYPNGITDESIVASILYDIANGLHNLHKQQQCHRNIRASSIHIDIDEGISLLSEFGELKTIKFKDKTQRRNTLPTELDPFFDPAIIRGDEKASWYANDIYAFGITALQLTYGSTPTLSHKDIMTGNTKISIDSYDKKSTFSKSFEQLINVCCAQKPDDRISVNKLIDHKFFKSRAGPLNIKQCFGHILKSTEKRINSSLAAPQSFNHNNNLQNGTNNNENINDLNGINNNNETQQTETTMNGYQVNIELNGNDHTNLNGNTNINNNNDNNLNNNGNANHQSADNPDWSFSTSIRKSELDKHLGLSNGVTPTVHEDQETDDQLQANLNNAAAGGPGMPPLSGYNDPSNQHKLQQPQLKNNNTSDEAKTDIPVGQKTRNYHVSFSASESESIPIDPEMTPQNSSNNQTFQINRFKVEVGSRLSESGTVPTQIEPSETAEDYEISEFRPQQDSDDGDDPPQTNSQNSDNNQQTTQIKRFFITPAKPEVSADECDDNNNNNNNNNAQQQQYNNNNNNQQPPQIQESQQEASPVQEDLGQQKPTQVIVSSADEWIAPSIEKSKWSASQCSEWVAHLGDKYKQYAKAFVDNGIDGEFFGELDDEVLKEIVPSALHRKKILSAWKK